MNTTIPTRIWIGASLLHRDGLEEFTGPRLIEKVRSLPFNQTEKSTLYAMLSQHVTANRPPTSFRLRYLLRLPSAERTLHLRLYRPGDECHPDRIHGKVSPAPDELPEPYRDLHEWYWQTYVPTRSPASAPDPILALRGLGKEVWQSLGGTKFIDELRADWFGKHRGPQDERLAPRKVAEFLREHSGCCDDCASSALDIGRSQVHLITTSLAETADFSKQELRCTRCGREKLCTTAASVHADGLRR